MAASHIVRELAARRSLAYALSGMIPAVLIIEDDDALREALVTWFAAQGIDAATAHNGRAGIDYLRRSPLPCLILLDLVMPEMSGDEVLLEIRRHPSFAPIPVAIVSADPSAVLIGKRLGANYVLSKPVRFEQLATILDRHCR